MNYIKSILLTLFLAPVIGMAAFANELDGANPITCASTELFECTIEDSCVNVQPEEINAPQFFKVDYKNKTLHPIPSQNKNHNTKIDYSKIIDGKLIMQGIDHGVEGVRDGLGWTLSVRQDNGKMTLSAVGDGVSFVIFGACTED